MNFFERQSFDIITPAVGIVILFIMLNIGMTLINNFSSGNMVGVTGGISFQDLLPLVLAGIVLLSIVPMIYNLLKPTRYEMKNYETEEEKTRKEIITHPSSGSLDQKKPIIKRLDFEFKNRERKYKIDLEETKEKEEEWFEEKE